MDLRHDDLTGDDVVITGSRQSRPNLPSTGCPFCVGGIEAPEPYDVRWFVNRWPAMPDDRCEVILYTPDHDASLWSLGVDGAARVVDLWAERTVALGSRDDVAYVLPFENRGPEVGATIAHPHGQIYAFDRVPAVPAAELASVPEASACPLCTPPAAARLVAMAEGWRAEVPYAATWPYALVLSPEQHVPDLATAGVGGRRALAAVLVDVLERLDRLFDAPMPYMLWVHQRPTDGAPWPGAHVHVHVAPLLRSPGTPRFVAAGELGSGLYFDPVVPEDAARTLREVTVG
ncbi:MAG TPA: hypothetical protein VHN98_04470 [Acidimicrobiales bacterium]|nr:hypothetical protein [Acidimicrobiales bacterium]